MYIFEFVLCILIVLNFDFLEWNDLRFIDNDIKVMIKFFKDIIILV